MHSIVRNQGALTADLSARLAAICPCLRLRLGRSFTPSATSNSFALPCSCPVILLACPLPLSVSRHAVLQCDEYVTRPYRSAFFTTHLMMQYPIAAPSLLTLVHGKIPPRRTATGSSTRMTHTTSPTRRYVMYSNLLVDQTRSLAALRDPQLHSSSMDLRSISMAHGSPHTYVYTIFNQRRALSQLYSRTHFL